jgi:hypothetical protein
LLLLWRPPSPLLPPATGPWPSAIDCFLAVAAPGAVG